MRVPPKGRWWWLALAPEDGEQEEAVGEGGFEGVGDGGGEDGVGGDGEVVGVLFAGGDGGDDEGVVAVEVADLGCGEVGEVHGIGACLDR